jgi:phosphoglycerate dehydrogenase-like enzyme
MSPRVLCLRPEVDFTRVDAGAPKTLDVTYRGAADADVPSLMKESDALVIPAVGPKLAANLFDRAKLKVVQVTGAGVDRLDRAALTQFGIPVANVPGGSNTAVAEYCVTAASALVRRIVWSDTELKAGNYVSFRARMIADNLAGLEGQTVGLVGFGTIGRAVGQAFHRLGAKLCFFDPAGGDPLLARSLDARTVTLDELLSISDVVSLHVPLLPATQNLIGVRELARMKKGAILIQASRGGIVDEAALAESLKSGHLGGAAVDVYSTEPPPADLPLFTLEGEAAARLLLTPHIAGVTRQASTFLFRSAWENVERVLVHGQPAANRVY